MWLFVSSHAGSEQSSQFVFRSYILPCAYLSVQRDGKLENTYPENSSVIEWLRSTWPVLPIPHLVFRTTLTELIAGTLSRSQVIPPSDKALVRSYLPCLSAVLPVF